MHDDKIDAYVKRFDQVFGYIERHLDEPLSIQSVRKNY